MLIRLIYLSRAVGPQASESTDSILQRSQRWNAQHDITGVLCEGQGVFLQVIEGERVHVTRLYSRIAADGRHTALELLHCEGITSRRYSGWSMASVNLSEVDPETKVVWPEFDPYSPKGALVMARIDDLVARGRAVRSPAS